MCNCAISFRGEIVTAVRLSQKVPRGAQDFAHVVSHISQMGSAVRAFTEGTHLRVCTMADHAHARDTPTRYRKSVMWLPVLTCSSCVEAIPQDKLAVQVLCI